MSLPEVPERVRLFGSKVGEAISRVMTQTSGNRWQLCVADEAVANYPRSEATQYLRMNLEGTMEGEAFLEIDAAALAVFSAGARDPKSGSAGGQGGTAVLSVLKGFGAQLEGLLAEQSGVAVRLEPSAATEVPDGFAMDLVGSIDEVPTPILLRLHVSKGLEMELQSHAAKPFLFPDAAPGSTSNLDLVLDVTLSVTLRFGQRQLALREVLELGSGSVVELDRQVDEPVELILDGRVVARGEAVIIDGNYGIRVTQVVQPTEA